MPRSMRSSLGSCSFLGLALWVALACGSGDSSTSADSVAGEPDPWRQLDPPAAAGSFAPSLATGTDEVLLTWWERLEASAGERRHRLMFARFDGVWSEPSVVAQDGDFFANWADIPSVLREPSGSLLAHWLAKTAPSTFAYSIFLARSKDDGTTWQALGRLNDDDTETEHGFVSLVREGEGVRAYWLDGRLMAEGGPMTVRSAFISETAGASELLDERVCECCPTDAVETAEGSMMVFRNREMDETREIHAVTRSAGTWSDSVAITSDGWRIPGCPVNGPAIDFLEGSSAVAWFTAAESTPRVSVAFRDGSEPGFGAALVVDGDRPLGRVGMVLDSADEAIVSWLEIVGDEAELRLRRVRSDGSMGDPLVAGRTAASRASGMPQLVRQGGDLYLAWVEIVEEMPSRIRMRAVAAVTVPAVGP